MIKLQKLYKKILIESKIDEDIQKLKKTFNSVTDNEVRKVLERLSDSVNFNKGYTVKNKKISCSVAHLEFCNLQFIPVYFSDVVDEFFVGHNFLVYLKGSPKRCHNFECNENRLVTLKECPIVKYDTLFYCEDNRLRNLKYGPKEVAEYNCSYNIIDTLRYGPIKCHLFMCSNNKLSKKEVLNFKKNNKGVKNIDAGF